ncbi:MAG: M56 family metallopeptidase [Bacteroidota bacterium]
MHTQLFAAGFLLALILSLLGLWFLNRLASFRDRRLIQFFILAAPASLMGTLSLDLAYMAKIGCLAQSSALDIWISTGLGLGLVLVAVLSLVHHARAIEQANRLFRALPGAPEGRAQALLDKLGAPFPKLWIVPFDRPLAFTIGILRPTIVLSQWVLTELDEQELEGVLAHEWVHGLHRDNLLLSLAAWLRDCAFYLFFVDRAFKSLLADKEFHADAKAAELTGRPAALASALLKFSRAPSLQLFSPSVETVVQGFGKDLLEPRIQALLGKESRSASSIRPWEIVLVLVCLAVLASLPSFWMPTLH